MGLADKIAAFKADQAKMVGCSVCRMIHTLDKKDAEAFCDMLGERSEKDPTRYQFSHPAMALFLKEAGITGPGGKLIGLDSISRHRAHCVSR